MYIIEKRNEADNFTGYLTETPEVFATLDEAEQTASDWQDYYQSKGQNVYCVVVTNPSEAPATEGAHFTGKDWQGRSVILTHKATGQAVRRSHSHPDFRGEYAHLTDARPPHKEGAAGFVYPAGGGEVYASVYDMKWSKA